MSLSGPEIYKQFLPKTNCGDCGIASCFTFATMVATGQAQLEKCPHVDAEKLASYRQQAGPAEDQDKFKRRDIAQEALAWARQRSASMDLSDLPQRVGGRLVERDGQQLLELPYFTDTVLISRTAACSATGTPLNHWEQVFIYNHLAQGGTAAPSGSWIAMQDIPDATTKVQTIQNHVEAPLAQHFTGNRAALQTKARQLGGTLLADHPSGADLAVRFTPLPRIPLLLLFRDEDPAEGFGAQAKVLFDETIPQHLDVESITFLCEHLQELLCSAERSACS